MTFLYTLCRTLRDCYPTLEFGDQKLLFLCRLFIQYIRSYTLRSEVVHSIRTVGRNPTIRRGTYFSSTSLLLTRKENLVVHEKCGKLYWFSDCQLSKKDFLLCVVSLVGEGKVQKLLPCYRCIKSTAQLKPPCIFFRLNL
jgi:hypothetical protein